MSEIHQQNSETRQTPVLTLDPSSVAKEKVQLEETTQQLEAMAQAAPSATAAAQAASEAVKQMDTTMLTEEDKKSIEEFVKKIDVNNSDHVLLYGADAQKKIADFSDSALATIRTKDTGEVGDMLVNLVNEIKGFSAAAEKPSGIKGLFWNAQKAVSDMQTKYDKVDANVDTIASQLENHQVQLLKDVSMFNHLYDMNTQYFKELTMYIIAGEQKLKEVREGELEELKKKKNNREAAISILRGISIRMPLLIYGAELKDESQEITIDNFASLIDPQSWEEFMPKGVTKQKFNNIKKYYDPEIFCAAGKRIRAMARAADKLSVEERIERITDIFSTFRNPDKETVLTPWRVVNMHLGDCLGGYNFFEQGYETTLSEPRFIDKGEVTANVFAEDSRILEINSKSGLYPLYMAYSIYRTRVKNSLFSVSSIEDEQQIWDKVVAENIFVICKTPMAKSITKRTLIGFRKAKVNTRYFEDLINQIKNKPEHFIKQVDKFVSERTGIKNMKFNAIVGNPPYQVMDGGAQASSVPVYQYFVSIAKKVQPNFISMIMPARWYAGGRGLDDFRADMLSDKTIRSLHDYPKASDLFSNVGSKVDYAIS